MQVQKVKYLELRPSEFQERLLQKPLAFLPLGTLEWHGDHLPLGADAIQSEVLMVAAAMKFGGIVLPPLFLGPDRRMDREDGTYLVGMDYAKSTSPHQPLAGSSYWVSYEFFKQLLENILEQLRRAGFKAVFADGHGPSRRTWCEMIPLWEDKFGMKLFGISDAIKESWNYMSDHAAQNETSITRYLRPDLVDMNVFTEGIDSKLTGVNGEHPFLSSAELGQSLFQNALHQIGSLLEGTP